MDEIDDLIYLYENPGACLPGGGAWSVKYSPAMMSSMLTTVMAVRLPAKRILVAKGAAARFTGP